MNTVRFELIELPYPTLARFGLTQEMIEDLPMRVLDEICDGRHSPVLPVRVRDEKGEPQPLRPCPQGRRPTGRGVLSRSGILAAGTL